MKDECKKFANIFPDFLDNELPDKEKEFAKIHLQKCKPCKIITEDVIFIINSLKETKYEITLDENFESKIISHILTEEKDNFHKFNTYFNIAASIIVIFLSTWFFINLNNSSNSKNFDLKNNPIAVVNEQQSKLVNFGASATVSNIKKINWVGFEVGYNNNNVVIKNVFPGNPAFLAGLRNNDIILKINGQNIKHIEQIDKIINSIDAGKILKFVVNREGKLYQFDVKVQKRYIKY